MGSSSIKLYPSHATAGQYVADTKTAGSCTLMLQAALPCLVFARPEGHDDAARWVGAGGGSCRMRGLSLH